MAMLKEIGDRNFPIWLLGDSNPRNWAETLLTPLDPRHPARHNIWTSIIDVIQDRVYRAARLRVDTSNLFIRNAIENPAEKPAGSVADWSESVQNQIEGFRASIIESKPVMILCFGAFAFEFGRRTLNEQPDHGFVYWGAKTLGQDFVIRNKCFNIQTTNIFPLIHATIARGYFIQSHDYFTGQSGANYFDFVGNHLADLFLKHKDTLPIWI